MTSQHNPGLFLVTDSYVPVLDSDSIANDIVARLERELVLANPSRHRVSYLPDSFFDASPDTPIVVLRRVLKNLRSFTFNA